MDDAPAESRPPVSAPILVAVGGGALRPLDPLLDREAGPLLAPCTSEGTAEAGRAALALAREDPDTTVYAHVHDGKPLAVYTLRKAGLSLEVTLLGVDPAHRRQGLGRACLQDALRRAGKRPLVVETDAAALAFYTAVGFKLVGKRRHPSGTTRFRLGWHAPRPGSASPAPVQGRSAVFPASSQGRDMALEGSPVDPAPEPSP